MAFAFVVFDWHGFCPFIDARGHRFCG